MITEWRLSERLAAANGLKPFKLERLGRIVVLVGPNGAGKSRILRQLSNVTQELEREIRLRSHGDFKGYERQLSAVRTTLTRVRGNPGRAWAICDELDRSKGANGETSLFDVVQTALAWRARGSAKIMQLGRPNTNSAVRKPEDIQAQQISQEPGIQLNLSQGWENLELLYNALARRAYIQMTDIPSETTQEQRADAGRRLEALKAALSRASGSSITTDISGELRPPLFDGKRITDANLSEGQKVLVSWFTALQATQQKLDEDLIVLIDEPELHLHPQVSVEVIAGLEKHLRTDSQIWLATHSVSLALGLQAKYGGDCSLVYVDKGHAQYASNRLDKVAEGLLGSKEARLAMRNLLADADEVEFYRFAADSLAPPAVAPGKDADPQSEQAVGLLKGRVLDYAPGRGRLAVQLAQGKRDDVEYYAFIPPQHAEHRSECGQSIKALYPTDDPELRIFSDKSAARSRFGDGFAQILLCNVLHEIPVEEWKQTFDRIHSMLSDEGELLLLEDQQLAKGELPHRGGFVVLAPDEVRDLFGVTSKELVKVVDVQHNQRLTAISIAKSALSRCSANTVKAALENVVTNASEKMDTFTAQGNTDARSGRQFAFYALQYTNASRYLAKH
jgi:ABC-type branched-subunit amino acid transport system ATPase component